MYHLRHPLLAFDRLRAVCKGGICVETHTCNHDPYTPSSIFFLDDVLSNAHSNWTGASESCVASWMLDAGFKVIYAEKNARMPLRQRFIGFVEEETFNVDKNNFKLLDKKYFSEVRREVESKLRIGKLRGSF